MRILWCFVCFYYVVMGVFVGRVVILFMIVFVFLGLRVRIVK